MSTSQSLKLTRAVKILLDLIYGLLVGATVILVVLIALAPFILDRSDLQLTASVPIAIGAGDEPQFEVEFAGAVANEIRAAFVDEAQGILRLETTSWRLILTSYLAQFLTIIGLAYVFYLLRSVVQSVLQGEIFTPENGVRIRRIGYLVLLVGFLRPTVEYVAAREILNRLTILEPALSLPSPFKAEVILGTLLILILAQIWSYGLELEREQALTI